MKKTEYDYIDDEEIRNTIIEKYGPIEENKERYHFSTNLRRLLFEKSIHYSKFAGMVGLGKITIYNYMNGERMPEEWIMVEKIAKQLGVTANYLIGREKCKTYRIQQVQNMLGIEELAILNLFSLKHDIEEVKEIDTKTKMSNAYEKHLETLSWLIADRRYLSYVLNSIRRYIDKKQEIKELEQEIEKSNGKNFWDNDNLETLEGELKYLKADIEHFLYKSLDNISDNLKRSNKQ